MTQVSGLLGSGSSSGGPTSAPKVGAVAISAGDTVAIGPRGKAFRANRTDYASVANKGSTVLAQTQVLDTAGTSYAATQQGRIPTAKFSDGGIYAFLATITAGGSISGTMSAAKFNADGTTRTATTPSYVNNNTSLDGIRLAILTNDLPVFLQGNITGGAGAGIYVSYNGGANTAIGTTAALTASSTMDLIALSGGGYAIAIMDGGSAKLVIYDNTGTVVSALQTVGALASANVLRLAQLANGNIMVAGLNGSAGGGIYTAVYSVLGAVVTAWGVSQALVSYVTTMELVVTSAGIHAIVVNPTGTKVTGVVIPAAGGAATATYASTISITRAEFALRAFADATYVYITTNTAAVIKATLAGVINATLTSTGSNSLTSVDACYDAANNVMAIATQGATTASVTVVDLDSMVVVGTSLALLTLASATAGASIGIIDLGDLFCGLVCDKLLTSHNQSLITLAKYADTAILGGAAADAAVGSLASVSTAPGFYGVGTGAVLKGAAEKPFNHAGASIPGVRGLVTNGGVSIIPTIGSPGPIPISITVKSGTSYTVPAGKLARFEYVCLSTSAASLTVGTQTIATSIAAATVQLTGRGTATAADVIACTDAAGYGLNLVIEPL
jgi:hypothetical protein